MRIFFMGTPDFSVTILHRLMTEHDIVGVFTQPGKPKSRGGKITQPPVKVFADAHGLPVEQPLDLKLDSVQDYVRASQPDVVVVAAYGRILPQSMLDIFPGRFINVHASILPKYRGAAPIQWAVRNRDLQSGVTLMRMDVGLDCGNILTQQPITLDARETTGSLFDKMADIGADLLLQWLPRIVGDEVQDVVQDEDRATFAPMFARDDEAVHWKQSALDIDAMIRSYAPESGCYTYFGELRLKITAADTCDDHNADVPPGTIVRIAKDSFLVQTGQGQLVVREVQPAGKKRMPAAAFINGYRPDIGSQFNATV